MNFGLPVVEVEQCKALNQTIESKPKLCCPHEASVPERQVCVTALNPEAWALRAERVRSIAAYGPEG